MAGKNSTMYHINISGGVISFDYVKAPRFADDFHAPNAKQYFAKRGVDKPKPTIVCGWPFGKIYITHGNEEYGLAVAWA